MFDYICSICFKHNPFGKTNLKGEWVCDDCWLNFGGFGNNDSKKERECIFE